ncbi:MAG: serine hydrolase [Acidobacteria bacterium]|nr:serine hydrolase [Acidobacteriota bacterium]
MGKPVKPRANLLLLLAGLLFVVVNTAQTRGQSVPVQTKAKPAEIAARLETMLPPLMKEAQIPGLSIALVRDGKLVWQHGYGVKNAQTQEPVTDTTVFEAASLSKPVFAYAVLKLVDAGKFDLDTPLNKYLPGNYDVADDARIGQITARHVLSHRTGFPNWRNGALKIFFTPGQRYSYSGEGFVYLAKVIEHVTGQSFNDFMKATVFTPLGMTNSSYIWQNSYDTQKTFRHDASGKVTGQNRQGSANAAASLHTTAQDFGLFVAAILQGRGLKPATRQLMLTSQGNVLAGGANSLFRPNAQPVPDVSWGLGWGLQTTKDGVSFWHWGDNGNCKAYVVAFEKQKLGVVFFANSARGLSIAREIVAATVGGEQPALTWLNYESYNSPPRRLLKNILAQGAEAALNEYRQQRKEQPANAIPEDQMNSLGYELLNVHQRVKDAIAVFQQNVADFPQSSNVYDSLGEAYAISGDKAQAIKNYERAVALDPNNTGSAEALKKLRATP